MLAELTTSHDAIVELCRRFGVRTLSVFGSVVSGDFDPARSDDDHFADELKTIYGREVYTELRGGAPNV